MDNPRDGLEFLDMLKEQNSDKGRTFDDLSEFLEQRARKKGVPIHGQFELTPLCSFSCKMCYAHLMPEQMKGRSLLTTEQWKSLVHDAYEAGMFKATLTGGECLTYPGFKEIYLYLHSLGCEVDVLTNGELLDEQWVEFFKEHMPVCIQITLYGYDNNTYERVTGRRSFDTVLENIKRVVEAELPLMIAITPNRFLGKDVLETIRLAKSLSKAVQVNSALFEPREETGRAGQDFGSTDDEYIEIYRMLGRMEGQEIRDIPDDRLPAPGGPSHECAECGLQCGGGRSCFVVDWKGTMSPCNRLSREISAFPIKEGFSESWHRINDIANNWPRVPECQGCPYDPVCNNCAADILLYTAPGKRPAALCERTRNMVRHGVLRISDCER